MRMKHFGGRKRRCQQLSALAATMVLFSTILVMPTTATAGELTSQQVADEILRLQAKADKTAEDLANAEMDAEQLTSDLATAQTQVAATSAQFDGLQSDVEATALARFTGSADLGSAGSIFFANPIGTVEADTLLSVAANEGVSSLDQIDATRTDLAAARDRVAALQLKNQELSAYLATRQTSMDKQLGELEQLRQRLKDDEVRRAYEAKLAAQRKKAAEQEAARQAAAAAEAAKQAAKAAKNTKMEVGASGGQPASANAGTSPPGLSSSSPNHPDPAPAPPAVVDVGDGWVCPVAGSSAFGDTWGAPRPGGRHHEGVDMMSPHGTPLVAVVAGNATMKTNNLGGNVVSLDGDDGNRYYYAHLSAWEGGSRHVNAGEVVGYVGATGDTTANHLHFEIHPGGGDAVNPYPTVRSHC